MDEIYLTIDPASVQYNDWKGSAAADDAHSGLDTFHELVGIDRGEWSILGVRIGRIEKSAYLTVYALNKVRHDVWDHDALVELGARLGYLPVERFTADVDLLDVLDRAFKRLSVVMTRRGVDGFELRRLDDESGFYE